MVKACGGAFWLLGDDIDTVGGRIAAKLMSSNLEGKTCLNRPVLYMDQTTRRGSLYAKSASSESLAAMFHTYAISGLTSIKWFVDDELFMQKIHRTFPQ